MSKPAYDSEKSDQMIIVIFDVPEDEKKKTGLAAGGSKKYWFETSPEKRVGR